MDASLNYREAAVQGASPVRLVVLLYEQVIDDLRRALRAQFAGQIEKRARYVDHALLVLGHLEATLDARQGGTVAANLKCFYQQVRAGLLTAQMRESAPDFEAHIAHLMLIRDAWVQVERSTPPTVASGESQDAGTLFEQHSSGEWRA